MTDQSLAAMSSADQLSATIDPATLIPSLASSSTPNTQPSNWDRWLRGQSWLESGIQNTGNANSSAHGYFQFLAGTADKAVKAGLPDPRIGSYDQQAAATQAYIQKFYPDAARAIESGRYGEAAKLLNKEWPSLPGGSQPQDFGRYLQWSGMLGGRTPGQMEYEKALGYDPATGAVQPGGIYDLTRQKQEAEENAQQRALDVQQADIGAMDRAWRREAAAPDDLRPWDAKAEQQKYSVTPTEAALNPGFWLAIFASAFTHTPMINALNGAAASINALKDGKDEEYKRAYAAWQANANLAIHRHELMHQDYEDAIQLYDRDFNLARSQALMVAAKYNDKLALSYLQNGLDDKFIGLIDNRDVKFTQFAQANAALTQYGLREDVYNGMLKQIAAYQQKNNLADDAPPIVALKLRAQAVLGAKSPMDEATAQAAFQFQMQNPNATPLQIMQFYTGMSAMNPATLEKNQANPKWWASPQGQALKKTLPPAEQQKIDTFVQQYSGSLGTMDKLLEKQNVRDAVKKEHPEWSPDKVDLEADRRIREAQASPMTGNKKYELQSHLALYDDAVKIIDQVTDTLDRYVGAAGLPGRATRLGERVSNLAGGTQTDRVQMMRDIEQLQLMAPQLLLDRTTGRPLSVEHGYIESIIAGLNAGDTTANTIRAMNEIRTRLIAIRDRDKARLGGSGENLPATSQPDSQAPGWDAFPAVH